MLGSQGIGAMVITCDRSEAIVPEMFLVSASYLSIAISGPHSFHSLTPKCVLLLTRRGSPCLEGVGDSVTGRRAGAACCGSG